MTDEVEHPAHYNSHPSGIECITVARWHSFNIGNVLKYLWRAGLKGKGTKIQDLLKAREYLNFEIELEQEKEKVKNERKSSKQKGRTGRALRRDDYTFERPRTQHTVVHSTKPNHR